MNGRSPNFPSPRFSGGTPSRNQHQFIRQPLYLNPNSPHLTPRGMSSPRNCSGSPDFIPLGVSSPVNRARQNWNQRSYNNNSSFSSMSTSPSSNSSFSNSPYKRHGSRGNFRGRGSFGNSSGSNSSHISHYIDRDALEDPWAELEGKLKLSQTSMGSGQSGSADTQSHASIVDLGSGSDSLDSDNEERTQDTKNFLW